MKSTPLPQDIATFRVKQSKAWRSQLDTIFQEMKGQQDEEHSRSERHGGGRHLALSITALEDVIMRQGMRMKEIEASNPGEAPDPYPSSYDPSSSKVEPTSGGIQL